MKNVLLTICYDGTNYHGWQIQKNAVTVQEVFQKALFKILGKKVDLKGCSRTDSGVHANMYCISVKMDCQIPCNRLKMALNRFLPHDISVISATEVSMDFHARYSCVGKEYVYKIWNKDVRNPFLYKKVLHYWYPIDINLLNESIKYFIGTHDFTSFCTLDNRDPNNMVRTIKDFKILKNDNLINIYITADGFLYNMVRIIVGTLIRVAMKKIHPDEIKSIIEQKDRSKAGPTVVPYGLYLNKVFYDNINFKSD